MTIKVRLFHRPVFTLNPAEEGARSDQLVGTDGEQITEYAGRKCYDSLGKGRSSDDFHAHLLEVGHGSVSEHASYGFDVDGVSRGFTHELVRHRVGVAISQRSTRYVDESESDYVEHPAITEMLKDVFGETPVNKDHEHAAWKARGAIRESIAADRRAYVAVVAAVEPWLISRGVDKSTARKQARGAARGYLGNALETGLCWTANVRTLRHVSWLRGSVHADAEARVFAEAVVECVRSHCPRYFADRIFTPAPDGLGRVIDLAHVGRLDAG